MFLDKENHYDVPKPLIKTDIEDQQESNNIPDVTFEMTSEIIDDDENKQQIRSAKDRMLLSTDDTSCLLFTQTITSPMLTPSEENIDFLKSFQKEINNTSVVINNDVDAVDKSEIEFVKTFTEPIYENLDSFKDGDVEHIYENVTEIKESELKQQINSESQEENTNVTSTTNSSIVSVCF